MKSGGEMCCMQACGVVADLKCHDFGREKSLMHLRGEAFVLFS